MGLAIDAAIDGATDLLGKVVGDLQANVAVYGTNVSGISKWVTGYTGFSGDPAEQVGNYLALHATADAGATIQAKLDGGNSGWITLDSDGILIAHLHDNSTTLRFRATKNGVTEEKVLSLLGVVKETA